MKKTIKIIIKLALVALVVLFIWNLVAKHNNFLNVKAETLKETQDEVDQLKAPTQFLETQTLLRKKKKELIENLEWDIITLYSQIEERKARQVIMKEEVNNEIEPKIRCWREAFYKELDCTQDYNLYIEGL